MNFHQNPSMLTNVFKLQIIPMRHPSVSGGPKCLKYQNVQYIHNFWHIGKPWERFQWWVRMIYFFTVPDDHTVSVWWVNCLRRQFVSLIIFFVSLLFVFLLYNLIFVSLYLYFLYCVFSSLFLCIFVSLILSYVEYHLFVLRLKAVFLNLCFSMDEHFQVQRLLIKSLDLKVLVHWNTKIQKYSL